MAECESSKVVDSAQGQQSPRTPSNRLSIGHLFLWMTTTACTLAVLAPEPNQDSELTSNAFAVGVAPVLGASIAALVLALRQAFHVEPQFPTQPGHWLSVAVGLVAGTVLVMMAIARMIPSPCQAAEGFEGLLVVAILIAPCAAGILLVIAALNDQMPLRWRLALRVVVASMCLIFTCGCLMPINEPTWTAPLALAIYISGPGAVLSAAAADIAAGTRYDLFHWIGVVTIPLMFGLPWALFFFS